MTKVLFNIGQDTIYGVYGVDTLVTAKAATRRVSGEILVTRSQLRESDSRPFILDLAPTGLGQAWIITVSPDNGDSFSGYYKVPAGDTVNFTDLIEVDPESLDATDVPDPEWWAVANSTINSGKVVNDHLILTRNDGVEVDAGNVRGLPGQDGVDGVNGAPGEDGVNGSPGRDGVSVVYTEIDDNGDLLVTLSNDQVVNAGRAKGRDANNVINFVEYGGIGDGVFNNASLLDQVLNECRTTKKTLFIPAGRYYSNGNHDISGCNIYGELAGYYNRAGTILVGDGANTMFEQKQVNLDNITHNIRALNIENVSQGIVVSYSIYSVFEDLFIKSSGTAFMLGIPTIIGAIWNQLNRVKCESTAGVALEVSGKDWNNSNKMDTCDFKGALAAVKVSTVGGFGAIDNVFINCEIRGAQLGFDIAATNRSTKIESCYIEPKGSALASSAVTHDLQMVGNIYGSTTNSVGLAPRFIDHRAQTLDIKIIGGWVTTNAVPEQANLDFIGSDVPANLTLDIVAEPRISANSAGFKLFNTATINETLNIQRGNQRIEKHSAPTLTLGYPDGTRPFSIRRNGSQGGSDFGVYFKNEEFDAMTIDSVGGVNILRRLGISMSVDATTPGNVVKKFPIHASNGTLLGYIPIYNEIV